MALPLRAARGADGRARRRRRSSRRAGCCSSTGSTGACTACSSSRARSRTWRSSRAVERGGRRAGRSGAVAMLATIATHPYGALVLASQGVYVLARARSAGGDRRDRASSPCSARPSGTATSSSPGRFEVGVGGGGRSSAGRSPCSTISSHVAGDFTAGFTTALGSPCSSLAASARALWVGNRDGGAADGLRRRSCPLRRSTVAGFGAARPRRSRATSIFVLPFFACLVALGLIESARRRALPVLVAIDRACCCAAEVAWGWDKTAPLFKGEPATRIEARQAASAWLASDARGRRRPVRVRAGLPRRLGARPRRVLGDRHPPGGREARARGAAGSAGRSAAASGSSTPSDTNNFTQRLDDPAALPTPASRVRGARLRPVPRHPQRGADGDAGAVPRARARAAQLLGKSLCIGDADINLRHRCDAAIGRLERRVPLRARSSRGGTARLRRRPGPAAWRGALACARRRRAVASTAEAPISPPSTNERQPARSPLARPWSDCRRRPRALCTLGDLLLDVIVRTERRQRARRGGLRGDARRRGRPGGERRGLGSRARRRGAVRRQARRRRRRASCRGASCAARGVEVLGPVEDGRNGVVVSLVGAGRRPDDAVRPRRRAVPARGGARACAGSAVATGCTCPGTRCCRRPIDEAAAKAAGRGAGRGGRVSVDLASASGIADYGPERLLRRLELLRPDLVFANEERAGCDRRRVSAARCPQARRRRLQRRTGASYRRCCPRRSSTRPARGTRSRPATSSAASSSRREAAARCVAQLGSDAVIDRLARSRTRSAGGRGRRARDDARRARLSARRGRRRRPGGRAARPRRRRGPATVGVLDGAIRVGLSRGRAGAVHGGRAQGRAARPGGVRRPGRGRRDDRRRHARRLPRSRDRLHGHRRNRRRPSRLAQRRTSPPTSASSRGREALVVSSGVKSLLDVPGDARSCSRRSACRSSAAAPTTLPLFYAADGGPAGARHGSRRADEAAAVARAHWPLGAARRCSSPSRRTESIDDVEPLIERGARRRPTRRASPARR